MNRTFERIVIAVPDLEQANTQYAALLGVEPREVLSADGGAASWWPLRNSTIELVQRAVEKPAIQGFVLDKGNEGSNNGAIANSLGLDMRYGDGRATAQMKGQAEVTANALAVDHIVLRTNDAQACIDLFGVEMRIRLALDKTVPEWGGRMLFFRTGKLTLEVIASDDHKGPSRFWGIAYQCTDLAKVVGRMKDRNVAVSDIRDGRKPGTIVSTVKSHCLDIPTLLIEPVAA